MIRFHFCERGLKVRVDEKNTVWEWRKGWYGTYWEWSRNLQLQQIRFLDEDMLLCFNVCKGNWYDMKKMLHYSCMDE